MDRIALGERAEAAPNIDAPLPSEAAEWSNNSTDPGVRLLARSRGLNQEQLDYKNKVFVYPDGLSNPFAEANLEATSKPTINTVN